MAPLQDITLQNLSDLQFAFSRALKGKCDYVIRLAIHGLKFLLIYTIITCFNSHHLALIVIQNVLFYLLSLGPNYEQEAQGP